MVYDGSIDGVAIAALTSRALDARVKITGVAGRRTMGSIPYYFYLLVEFRQIATLM